MVCTWHGKHACIIATMGTRDSWRLLSFLMDRSPSPKRSYGRVPSSTLAHAFLDACPRRASQCTRARRFLPSPRCKHVRLVSCNTSSRPGCTLQASSRFERGCESGSIGRAFRFRTRNDSLSWSGSRMRFVDVHFDRNTSRAHHSCAISVLVGSSQRRLKMAEEEEKKVGRRRCIQAMRAWRRWIHG